MADDALRLIVEPDLHAVAAAARNADKKIYRDLRAAIRKAGEDSVKAVRQEIGQIPSSGRYSTGVRAALQAGTRLSMSVANQRTAGVRIVTDPRRLPANKRALAKAFNKERFRHPVMGDPRRTRRDWAWVEQPGRPYFGRVILARQQQMTTDIWRALKQTEYAVMRPTD